MTHPTSVSSLSGLLSAGGRSVALSAGAVPPAAPDPAFESLVAQHHRAQHEPEAPRRPSEPARGRPGGGADAADAEDATTPEGKAAHRTHHDKKHGPCPGTGGQQPAGAAMPAGPFGVQADVGGRAATAGAEAAGQQAAAASTGSVRTATAATASPVAAAPGSAAAAHAAGPVAAAGSTVTALAATAVTPKAGAAGQPAGKADGKGPAAGPGSTSARAGRPRHAAGPAKADGSVPARTDGPARRLSADVVRPRPSDRSDGGAGTSQSTAATTPSVAGVPGTGPVHQPTGTAGALSQQPGAHTLPGSIAAQVQPTVVRLVSRGDGTHRMTLQLHPADLGEVRVTVTVKDGAVDVSLAAAPAAQDVLRDGATQLRSLLAGSGHTLGQLVLRDLPGAAAAQNDAGQGGAGQNGAGQNGQSQAWGQGQSFGQAPHHQGRHLDQPAQQLAQQLGQQSGQQSGQQPGQQGATVHSSGRHGSPAVPAGGAAGRRTPAGADADTNSTPRTSTPSRAATGLDLRI